MPGSCVKNVIQIHPMSTPDIFLDIGWKFISRTEVPYSHNLVGKVQNSDSTCHSTANLRINIHIHILILRTHVIQAVLRKRLSTHRTVKRCGRRQTKIRCSISCMSHIVIGLTLIVPIVHRIVRITVVVARILWILMQEVFIRMVVGYLIRLRCIWRWWCRHNSRIWAQWRQITAGLTQTWADVGVRWGRRMQWHTAHLVLDYMHIELWLRQLHTVSTASQRWCVSTATDANTRMVCGRLLFFTNYVNWWTDRCGRRNWQDWWWIMIIVVTKHSSVHTGAGVSDSSCATQRTTVIGGICTTGTGARVTMMWLMFVYGRGRCGFWCSATACGRWLTAAAVVVTWICISRSGRRVIIAKWMACRTAS